MEQAVLQAGSGLLESVAQLAVLAGTLLLAAMVVALVGYAYKSLQGNGIEWPEDREEEADAGVSRGSDDDEWDYY